MLTLFAKNSVRHADRPAFRDAGQLVTWQEAERRIRQVLALWQRAGERSGQRVALFLEQNVDSVLILLAALGKGDQIALLDPRMSAAEWERTEQALQPEQVLGSAAVLNRLSVTDLGRSVADTLAEAQNEEPSAGAAEAEGRGSLLFLTSGSTGQPKFVERFVPALRAEGRSYVQTLDLTERDVFYAGLPLFHSYAFGCALLAALECGGCLVIPPMFYPPKVVQWIRRYDVTFLPLVPSLVRLLVDSLDEPVALPSLRYAMVGTGQTTPELAAKFQEKLGLSLSGNYGSSETGGLVSRLESMEQAQGATGRAMSGVKLLIADEAGQPVPTGVTGQVLVETAGLFSGYLGMSAPTASAAGGWWKMGDLGYLDEEGRLHVTGRISNVLQRNGKKISAEYLESALLRHEGILEAAVVGVRSGEAQDDRIYAVVVQAPGATLDAPAVRMHCFETAGRHASPDEVIFVEELPRSANGKLLRGELLAAVRSLSGGALS